MRGKQSELALTQATMIAAVQDWLDKRSFKVKSVKAAEKSKGYGNDTFLVVLEGGDKKPDPQDRT